MALVELTGTVATWANGIHDGLGKAGIAQAAAVFAPGPPFASSEPTAADYERLTDFVEACMEVLEQVLASDAA